MPRPTKKNIFGIPGFLAKSYRKCYVAHSENSGNILGVNAFIVIWETPKCELLPTKYFSVQKYTLLYLLWYIEIDIWRSRYIRIFYTFIQKSFSMSMRFFLSCFVVLFFWYNVETIEKSVVFFFVSIAHTI